MRLVKVKEKTLTVNMYIPLIKFIDYTPIEIYIYIHKYNEPWAMGSNIKLTLGVLYKYNHITQHSPSN